MKDCLAENFTSFEDVKLNIEYDCCAFKLIRDLLGDCGEFPYLNDEVLQSFFQDRVKLLQEHSEELKKIFNSLYGKN